MKKTRIYTDARILSDLHSGTYSESLVIEGATIVFVGSIEEAHERFPDAEEIALGNKTVVPGFIDSHIHGEMFGRLLKNVNLTSAASLQEAKQLIADRVRTTPKGKLIQGRNWNKNDWQIKEFPTRWDLDAVSTDHPLVFFSKDGHAAWANSLAIEQSKITRNTPDPDGGKIVRDSDSGEPTGIFFENAEDLLGPVFGETTEQDMVEYIPAGLREMAKDGITGIRTLDSLTTFKAWQTLLDRGQLSVRICYYFPDCFVDALAQLGFKGFFGNQWLSIGGLKGFLDGALGSQTAEMFEPYERAAENCGIRVASDAYLYALVRKATMAGLPVAMHGIGDKANNRFLNTVEKVREQFPDLPWPRHSLEHAQLLQKQDIPRMSELNVIASMQPIHVSGDWAMADRDWGLRSEGAYAFRSLLDCGTKLVFGSDSPVEVASPMLGIRAAVTRTDLNRQPEGGWYPEQRLTPLEAIRAYTIDAAYAQGFETFTGSLEAGKQADFVVLDIDPLKDDPFEFSSERVVMTFAGGRLTFDRNAM